MPGPFAPDQGFMTKSAFARSKTIATLALLPAASVFLVVYVGCALWSVAISFTGSKMIPNWRWVGTRNYDNLFADARWDASITNLLVFGPVFVVGSLVVGFVLAILLDLKIRGEDLWRTLFLYSYSTSFIVTGMLWRWLLDPGMGAQRFMRDLGFTSFTLDWTVNPDRVIFALALAAIWHSAGLVMALALAGLRAIDPEIWKALRVEGVPIWRGYIQVVIPMMWGTVFTAFVLLSIAVIKVYDLVVAMTSGGPGFSSEMPAKFVMDYLFDRGNVGLATAATSIMLLGVIIFLAPWILVQRRQARRATV